MVAAGATTLMAASESGSTKGAENIPSRYDVQHAQRSCDNPPKRTVKVEKKNSIRSPTSNKTACIRETKASRLRAASIVSPTEGPPASRKSVLGDNLSAWSSQTGTNLPRKPKTPMSSSGSASTCVTRDKDKTTKRNSCLIKSSETDEKRVENSNYNERTERRVRRQTGKQLCASSKAGLSTDRLTESHDNPGSGRRLNSLQQSPGGSTMAHASSSIASSSGMKPRASTQRSSGASGGHDNSEVLRRVDALTALTRATMERVERLTSHSSPSVNGRTRVVSVETDNAGCSSSSTKSCGVTKRTAKKVEVSDSSILRGNGNSDNVQTNVTNRQQTRQQPPISILKHKVVDLDTLSSSSSSSSATASAGNAAYTTAGPSAIAASAAIVDRLTKKHGILKKRSSLDDNEILRRRRSCSPDVVCSESNEVHFRPILKNERRSSLDELVKRSRSPDQPHPTSILKRKSLGEEEREDGQIGSAELTSILKRSSGNSGKNNGPAHHVSIAAAVAKTLGCMSDNINGSEVRPILKKKLSREESSSSDPPSLDPRPILKKKSSTDSDEHDEKPKKTILKSSRKSSQEDSGNEMDGASPKKLSMLKNRSAQRRTNSLPECDGLRPILKQSSSRESSSPSRSSLSGTASPGDGSFAASKDLFLRKRARSVGHMQSSLNGREDWMALLEPEGSLNCTALTAGQQEKVSFSQLPIDRTPSQNITSPRSNESATTSSIAPIVSFKLPSREEMEHRYEEYNAHGDEGADASCPEFRHNFEKCSRNDNDEDDDDYDEEDGGDDYENDDNDDDDDNEIDLPRSLGQNSCHRREKIDSLSVRTDISLSKTQKSQQYELSSVNSDEVNSIKRFASRKNTDSLEDRKGAVGSSIERRTNVSQIAQRFKALEEQVKTTAKESLPQYKSIGGSSKYARGSKEQQRYDRFNTQPVTYEEVREAVLQNQRNVSKKTACNSIFSSSDDCTVAKINDVDPSKLSLADRVRLFNQRIATETIANAGVSVERSHRRRPANRYKTQPITSEEVEVASRSIPTTLVESDRSQSEIDDSQRNDEVTITHQRVPSTSIIPPRSILKYSTSQTASDARSRTSLIYETEKIDSASTVEIDNAIFDKGLTLTRKENRDSASRRLQRRNRNIESIIERRETQQRLSTRTELQETIVPSEYNAFQDKDCISSTSDGFDTADNVETTNECVLSRKRIKRGVLSASDESRCTSEIESISYERRDKIMTDMPQINFPSISIADRLAALQRSGTTDWKRRVTSEPVPVSSGVAKFAGNDNERSIITQAERDDLATKQRKLADRLEKLESAAEGWRKRVAIPDAVKFSVAGKMKVEQLQVHSPGTLSPLIEVATNTAAEGRKKTRRPERFRSTKTAKDTLSTSSSPEEGLKVPEGSSEPVSDESGDETKSMRQPASILSVPRADDETFTSFFSNVSLAKCEAETLDFAESDFDVVTSFSQRLGTRRTVKTQQRRLPSKNPLRTLAARTDIKDEYTEVTTGVAERVMKTLNVERLAKNSSLAVEALAGLASTEDFGAVTLKNVFPDSTGYGNRLPPHKDLMLILVKGRRHVQVRLVEPIASSINSGDNFILVTKNELYNYVGKYSNVIERARGAEIALSIQQNKDLRCRASNVITVSEEKPSCTTNDVVNFWKLLGADAHKVEVVDGGHPDEDELYESALMDTNIVYEVVGEDELMPFEKYWGAMPKIEMLDPSKILVFDFGSEMYIWNGKIAPSEKRKVATHLAEELWQEGYDYTECTVSPINSASIIGRRAKLEKHEKKARERPKWCLLAKLTQHMETILFREKFLDWPNVSGVIRVKKCEEKEAVDGKIIIDPPDVDAMIDSKAPVVDLILEGSHLGRGTGWYDDELLRQSMVATTNVTVWHIDEFSYSPLNGSSVGQFYTGDSYIVRWMYTITITGRGLSGEPSKHSSKGRDRCAYFIWQGKNASLNEQGTAALLTVELDQEQGPQVRVVEGFEPAAFLNLFSGKMIVHAGKKSKNLKNKKWRMYVCRGSEETETSLTEVPCSTRQLRSRGSLLLLDTKQGYIYVWHGRAALPHVKKNALKAANVLKSNRPEEAGLNVHINVTIREINEEDDEPAEFFEALGGMNKQLYVPLLGKRILNHTSRLFHLSSVSGEFAATELLSSHRSDLATPFPFLQEELYQVNQPALFLLDNKDELWLWQGWWPDSGAEDQTGSGAVRWQAERRAAMIMAMRYWNKLHPQSGKCPVYLVWAGLEPLEFTNLFPTWTYHDDIAELNIRDGRDSGEVLTVEGELARLTQSTYPPAQLLQRPLPEGVDPTTLEQYLSPQHFEELLGMNVEEFEELPAWKQINIKKKIGLF